MPDPILPLAQWFAETFQVHPVQGSLFQLNERRGVFLVWLNEYENKDKELFVL